MAKSFDWLGDNKGEFFKQSLIVSNNLSGNQQIVGKTQNEMSFNMNLENVEWFSNAGGTQTLFALDIDKIDPTLTFSFMQVIDKNVLQLALNADFDASDPNVDRHFIGSNPDTYSEAEWRLTGSSVGVTGDASRSMTMIWRRGIAFASGDISWGAPGAYSEVPVTMRGLQDTSIANTKRDVLYFEIAKRTFS